MPFLYRELVYSLQIPWGRQNAPPPIGVRKYSIVARVSFSWCPFPQIQFPRTANWLHPIVMEAAMNLKQSVVLMAMLSYYRFQFRGDLFFGDIP